MDERIIIIFKSNPCAAADTYKCAKIKPRKPVKPKLENCHNKQYNKRQESVCCAARDANEMLRVALILRK